MPVLVTVVGPHRHLPVPPMREAQGARVPHVDRRAPALVRHRLRCLGRARHEKTAHERRHVEELHRRHDGVVIAACLVQGHDVRRDVADLAQAVRVVVAVVGGTVVPNLVKGARRHSTFSRAHVDDALLRGRHLEQRGGFHFFGRRLRGAVGEGAAGAARRCAVTEQCTGCGEEQPCRPGSHELDRRWKRRSVLADAAAAAAEP
mmetsp:Transcript_45526/g.115760  ORF Transcript_45526/g.115760 Transcript_45526/m.115760 type:complete len:204 (-) Transcript_45526:8-619(-)